MAAKIFISYRRDDAAALAGRVYDRLVQEFGRDSLFMDVDSIPLGVDFVNALDDEVAKCDVLLAIIDRGWFGARGKRRLDNPHDFVRIEIAAALRRDIPVIPILVDGTRIPKADQLPDDLKELASRNGLDLRHASFHNDMDRLIRALGGGKPQPATTSADRMRSEGRIKIDAAIIHGAPDGWFLPGNGKAEWFKDHEDGPEMVVIPAGEFMMGSHENEPGRLDYESPLHRVKFARPLPLTATPSRAASSPPVW